MKPEKIALFRQLLSRVAAGATTISEAMTELIYSTTAFSQMIRQVAFDALYRRKWERAVSRARSAILADWGRWRFDRALDRAWFQFRKLQTGEAFLATPWPHGFKSRWRDRWAVEKSSAPPPPHASRMIRAVNRSGHSQGWEIFDHQGNQLRLPAHGLTIRAKIEDVNRIEIDCNLVQVDVAGVPTWRFAHPVDGIYEQIDHIQFADGTTWIPGDLVSRGGS